jgi:hypothetical protein
MKYKYHKCEITFRVVFYLSWIWDDILICILWHVNPLLDDAIYNVVLWYNMNLVQVQSVVFTSKLNELTAWGAGELPRCKENQILVTAHFLFWTESNF